MVKFGEIVKVTEARKPKNGIVKIKHKSGALMIKIVELIEEHPGITAKQLAKHIFPGDPKGEPKVASWLWSQSKKPNPPFVRRKQDGVFRIYPATYFIPGGKHEQAQKNEKPKGTIASGVLSESLAQALFNYYAANKEPNLQGFIKYLKDLEG